MRASSLVSFALCLVVIAGCGEEGAPAARRTIRERHAGEVQAMLRGDVQRHRAAIPRVANLIARGFELPDPANKELQLRAALRMVDQPRAGITDLLTSPKSFMAAVGADGIVIARDLPRDQHDDMKGMNFGELFGVVRRALHGELAVGLEDFPAADPTQASSPQLLFAAPSRVGDRIVGAAVLGIPLWKLEQRISLQLRNDHGDEVGQGAILWSYVYRGDQLIARLNQHPDLDTIAPTAAERAEGLRRSPGGFTLQKQQFGRWYAFGVLPIPSIGENFGVVIVRSDPI